MRVSVSLTTKVMFIMLTMMLTVSVVISVLLINQSNSNMEREQQEIQLENIQRFTLFQKLFADNVMLWAENVASLALSSPADDQSVRDAIERAREPLAFNLGVDRIWLFNEADVPVYGDALSVPEFVRRRVDYTRAQLEPGMVLDCEVICRPFIFVPVMTAQQGTAVFVLSGRMTWLLALLSESTGLAAQSIVQKVEHPTGDITLELTGPLSSRNQTLLPRVLTAMSLKTDFDMLIHKGVRLELDNHFLLINAIPLTEFTKEEYYILFVQDVSDTVISMKNYQQIVVGSAVLLFLLFALLMYLFLTRYRRKLMNLSKRLPLLAQHRYQDFHLLGEASHHGHGSRLTDELDVLEDVAADLAEQLEDIDSEMAQKTAQLERMAMFDNLTGLPNRNMLTFQIEKQLATAARESVWVALMFLDLDDFKKVNDSYGHDVGDKLLKAAARRIIKPIRETDIASRFGGDEFVILLDNITGRDQVETVARKLLNEFSTPIEIGDMQFYITISIGIAVTQQSQVSAMDLLRHADIAMYEAKARKGAGYQIYDATMNLKVMRKVEMESEARVALREDQFSLALQPQLELRTRKLVGFEALIRWHHPEKGPISPGEFIPLLENTSFMLELDYWVIAHAIRLLSELESNGYPQIKMAINVSSAQFLDATLPTYLQQQLQANSVDPSSIALELTETVLVADMVRATAVMKSVRELGCQIAIDDFGTGYSSLSYLKALPTDYIKIDQSFIAGMIESRDDRSIVHSTITMIRSMGLTVIAEGIEEAAQYELLCLFDCHQGQGYLINRPIPEGQLWKELNENVKNGVWSKPLPVFKPLQQNP